MQDTIESLIDDYGPRNHLKAFSVKEQLRTMSIRQRIFWPLVLFGFVGLLIMAAVVLSVRHEFSDRVVPRTELLMSLEVTVAQYEAAILTYIANPRQEQFRQTDIAKDLAKQRLLETETFFNDTSDPRVAALARSFQALIGLSDTTVQSIRDIRNRVDGLEDLEQQWRGAIATLKAQVSPEIEIHPQTQVAIANPGVEEYVFDLLSEFREYLEFPNDGTLEEIDEALDNISQEIDILESLEPIPATTSSAIAQVVSATGTIIESVAETLRQHHAADAAVNGYASTLNTFQRDLRSLNDDVWDRSFRALENGFLIIIAATAVLVLVATWLSWLFAHRLSRDLAGLSQTAQHIGNGNLTARTTLDRGDEIGVLAGSLNDMASRIETLVDEIDRHRLEAERANRAKGDFLAQMSHELRTPLNAIVGFTDAMRIEVFGPINNPRYRSYLDDIRDSSMHVVSMISDLLEMARLESGRTELDKETLLVDDMLRKVQKFCKKDAIDAGVILSISQAPGIQVVADSRALIQMLLNLVSNAVKFSDRGDTVRVDATKDANGVFVSVSDRGPGIAPEDIARVTDPYFQCAENPLVRRKGIGLGLALTRQLVELHGGTLSIDSEIGEGTTVTLFIPDQN